MYRVLLNLVLPVRIKKKAKVYVSSCDVFDVHSQGYSLSEAEKNLIEAIKIFFISCYERGTLDEAFKECGFQPVKALKKPTPSSIGKFSNAYLRKMDLFLRDRKVLTEFT